MSGERANRARMALAALDMMSLAELAELSRAERYKLFALADHWRLITRNLLVAERKKNYPGEQSR